MGLDIASIGTETAGKAVDGIMGLVVGGHNDRRQLRQQKKLQAEQIKGMKEMSDYQQAQQLEMWNKTNYGAQIAHMEKAGLNAGLMYGMSGGGGATTGSASGGGVSGGSAQGSANEIQNQMSMGLMMAQKANIEADTKKKLVEADVTGGVGKEKTTAETANIEWTTQLNKALGNDLIEKLKGEAMSAGVKGERDNLEWELEKEFGYRQNAWDKDSPKAKDLIAKLGLAEVELKKAKLDNNIKEAEITIKQFEANLAREGIPPNSPWGVKIIGDLLRSTGIGEMIGIGKQAVKGAIK